MGFKKNTSGQEWQVFAFDTTTNLPETGDAANITAKISKDGGALTATNDTNPTEEEGGFYSFTLTQAETNADKLFIVADSGTANIEVIGLPMVAFTRTYVSSTVIDDSRTWHARYSSAGYVSDEVITVQPGFSGTMAVDFTDVLNPGTVISTVDSVSDEASQSPAITIDNLAASQDKTKAHFDISDITDNKEYRLKVTVTTTDSQTLPVDCRLDGEETP